MTPADMSAVKAMQREIDRLKRENDRLATLAAENSALRLALREAKEQEATVAAGAIKIAEILRTITGCR